MLGVQPFPTGNEKQAKGHKEGNDTIRLVISKSATAGVRRPGCKQLGPQAAESGEKLSTRVVTEKAQELALLTPLGTLRVKGVRQLWSSSLGYDKSGGTNLQIKDQLGFEKRELHLKRRYP